jgi:hypothetical protein
MVTEHERQQVLTMIRLGHWQIAESMRLPWIQAKRFGALLKLLQRRQKVDALHHAPCCPANHYHRQRLVFRGCTCGAQREEDAP